MSVLASSSAQGTVELTLAVVFGIVCVAFLVVGVVVSRRGGDRARMWFGLSAATLIVGSLVVALT